MRFCVAGEGRGPHCGVFEALRACLASPWGDDCAEDGNGAEVPFEGVARAFDFDLDFDFGIFHQKKIRFFIFIECEGTRGGSG